MNFFLFRKLNFFPTNGPFHTFPHSVKSMVINYGNYYFYFYFHYVNLLDIELLPFLYIYICKRSSIYRFTKQGKENNIDKNNKYWLLKESDRQTDMMTCFLGNQYNCNFPFSSSERQYFSYQGYRCILLWPDRRCLCLFVNLK